MRDSGVNVDGRGRNQALIQGAFAQKIGRSIPLANVYLPLKLSFMRL